MNARDGAQELYDALPPRARALVDRAYELYLQDQVRSVTDQAREYLTIMNNTREVRTHAASLHSNNDRGQRRSVDLQRGCVHRSALFLQACLCTHARLCACL